MQNVDLRNKSYKQFLVKNKSGAAREKKLTFFFNCKFFLVFLNIVCLDQIQKSHKFYKEKLQSLN